jgi:regulator of protease activity HflC (stomatin/prohibitin superfamily)
MMRTTAAITYICEINYQDEIPGPGIVMTPLSKLFSDYGSKYPKRRALLFGMPAVFLLIVVLGVAGYVAYWFCRIEVPSTYMAVLTKKTGYDLDNSTEFAASEDTKGVQLEVLGEGRYFYSPYDWKWEVVPQVEVPKGKLGVRIRLYGDELPPGEIIARTKNQKGIVPDYLPAGRYAINALVLDKTGEGLSISGREYDNYAEIIEIHNPVTIPAGYKGVVTKLSDKMPVDPNQLLSEPGTRGVQTGALDAETIYFNPYVERINLVDCRSQRFNISQSGEMGFPSKDGFWVSLDGVIEFRVKPEEAAKVFVAYNDNSVDGERVDREIIDKIILPNARSFCRLQGSNHSGREFISGETRVQFQQDFQKALAETCDSQGIEIVQALITTIRPPQKIASPVRDRQIALQEELQYQQEVLQQLSEQELAVEKEMVERGQSLVAADQSVVKVVTEAMQRQEVAIIGANQRLKVAEFKLEAAQDTAAAVVERGKAVAEVIKFHNEAEAAGWRKSVEAFNGDGNQYSRWVLLQKLAPAYRQMMINTADSPLMDVFELYKDQEKVEPAPR